MENRLLVDIPTFNDLVHQLMGYFSLHTALNVTLLTAVPLTESPLSVFQLFVGEHAKRGRKEDDILGRVMQKSITSSNGTFTVTLV